MEGRWSRFVRALQENAAEFLFIFAFVLSAYVLPLLWLKSRAFDGIPVAILQKWDHRTTEVHEFLEKVQPGIVVLVCFQAVVIMLRLVSSILPSLRPGLNIAGTAFTRGLKWLGRASTATALAAGMTFLATGEEGLLRPIGLALRDAKREYRDFQRSLTERVDEDLRQNILARAWRQRPPAVVHEMARSAEFDRERDDYGSASKKAQALFDIPPDRNVKLPAQTGGSLHRVQMDPDETGTSSAVWSTAQIMAAEKEISASRPQEVEVLRETSDELSKKLIEKLSPADIMFAQGPVEALKSSYPAFGEFLDVINASISESVFDSIRQFIVRRATEMLRGGESDITSKIEQLTEAEAAKVQFGWEQWHGIREREINERIDRDEMELAMARGRLEDKASVAQAEKIRRDLDSQRKTEALMNRVGLQTDVASLHNKAFAVHALIVELAAIGARWPPLRTPNKDQRNQLSRSYAVARGKLTNNLSRSTPTQRESTSSPLTGFDINTAFDDASINQILRNLKRSSGNPPTATPRRATSQGGGFGQHPGAPRLLSAESVANDIEHRAFPSVPWTDPIDAIESIESYCADQLIATVGRSATSAAASGELRKVMGDAYAGFNARWDKEVQQREEARQREIQAEIAQRVEQARRAEEIQRQREQMRREYEHPVEVP